MACRILKKVCKTEGETKRYSIDYAGFDAASGSWGFLVRQWSAGTAFDSGVCVRPSRPTGFQYRSSGGQSGNREPKWPATLGGTVADGPIVWTAEALNANSLKATITASEWASDVAIDITDEQLQVSDGLAIASALIGGGAEGESYEVSNVVTLSDGGVEESVLQIDVA